MREAVIGAHVSTAGGLPNAVFAARHIGAAAIQIFGSSPRQWAVRMPLARDATEFKKVAQQAGLHSVFLHAPYLVNLGTSNIPHWKRSVELLVAHMKIAAMIDARGVIVHVGSGEGGLFRERSFERAAAGVKQVLRRASPRHGPGQAGPPMFLIENSAGGGEKIGKDMQEIALLIKRIGSTRVGVCLDTAHAFEAGIAEYSVSGVLRLADEIKKTIGWNRLIAIHANDSKTAFGSRNDRHENIGKGLIGTEGFKNLLANPDFRKTPFLLEVPGYDGKGPDKKNVDMLKKLSLT
jgi:deoxyribonuclease-4